MPEAGETAICFEETACALCGCNESELYLRIRDFRYHLPGEFQLVRCDRCGHVFVNPRPTLGSIGRFYPDHYGPHQPPRKSAEAIGGGALPRAPAQGRSLNSTQRLTLNRPWYLSRPVRALPGLRRLYYWLADQKAELIPPVKPQTKTALELGCATGRFLNRLSEAGWHVQGVELSENAAVVAKQRGFDVHTGTLQSAGFEDRQFDAAFAWMVLEHLHDPRATLCEIHRILQPSGWLVFSVPNFGCWEPRAFGRYWYGFDLPRHLHHFTPRTIRRLLTETGFEEVRLVHQRNALNLVGTLGIWLNETFSRRRLGQRLIDYVDDPGLWGQLALAPLAKVLAWIRQGGRLTVLARRS